MAQEDVGIVGGVRTPVAVRSETRRRSLDERLLARFPAVARGLSSLWSRLAPRSRLRRAILSRIMRQGCEAANRRDFDLLFLLLDPEIEFRFGEGSALGGMAPPDMVGVHRGHAEYLRLWEMMIEVIEDIALIQEEVIDFGDRLLASGRFTGHGSHSGLAFDRPVFQVFTLRHGLVIRQQDFADRAKALDAVGLE
jgi:ketosteroid isomerase-like protein